MLKLATARTTKFSIKVRKYDINEENEFHSIVYISLNMLTGHFYLCSNKALRTADMNFLSVPFEI